MNSVNGIVRSPAKKQYHSVYYNRSQYKMEWHNLILKH